MPIYLAQWAIGTSPSGKTRWEAPASADGVLDVRPLSEQASLSSGGFGVFTYPSAQTLGGVVVALGSSLDGNVSGRDRSEIQRRMGVALPANVTVRELLAVLLTEAADAATGPMPLMPTSRNRLVAHVGEHSVMDEPFTLSHAHAGTVVESLREQYRRQRELDAPDGAETHLKRLGWWARQYGEDYRTFIPSDLPDEGVRDPATTITESFNKANNGLGPDLSWTTYFSPSSGVVGVDSNQAHFQSGGEAEARADSDLSSDDHYSHAIHGTDYADGGTGVVCRKDSTATQTIYRWANFVTFAGGWELVKFVSGAETALDTAYTTAPSAGETLRVSADGSTIKGYHIGSPPTERASVTDTSVTGNVRCGIFLAFVTDAYLDDFEASDIAAGGNTVRYSLPVMGVG